MESRFVALRFRCPIADEEALQGFMLTHCTVEGIEETSDGAILFYVPQEEWHGAMQQETDQFISAHPDLRFLGSERLEERDWNAEWEASIEPQQVTEHLVITPSWKREEANSMAAQYLITIDPKMSFGTGHHETTRLCLGSIETLDVTDRAVLDLGTGSGVLAIYALIRGARRAIGIDTDPWSIQNAEENRELNDILPSRFEIRAGTLETAAAAHEAFDVILANIHRNVLIAIAAPIRSHCTSGADVILSGLLIYDVPEVRTAYESTGFEFVRELRENEWACLTFTVR